MATPMLPDESPRGLNLASIIETVRRRRFLALLPLVLVLAAVTTLAFFLPSLWTARATVLVNGQQIPEAYVRSSVSSGDVEARLLTLTHQILDGPRLAKIIEQYNLYPAMRQTHAPADVVERMRRDIRVEIPEERERRNREARWLVFTVAYTTTDRTVAVDVTNTLAALFDEENRRTTEQQAVGTSEFLETQLRELRTRLTGQEQKITAYKEQHLGELPEQREVNLRTIERLQLQLSIAGENNRRAGERRQLINQSLNDLDVASAMAGSGGTGATGLGETPAAARLAALRQELTALQTTYSDKYPDVISTKEQIRLLEVRVAQEDKKLAAAQAAAAASPKSGNAPPPNRASRDLRLAATNPYVLSLMQQLDQASVETKAASEEIAGLQRQLALYERRLEATPKREAELATITRDYETTRDTFRSLLAKRGEADIAASLEQGKKGETFRIIDPARPPDRPTGPNRMRLLLVGLVLAFGAAGAAVVLAEQVDTSYRRADEVRDTAGVPLLSTIPRIVTDADRTTARRQRGLAVAAMAVALVLVVSGSFFVAHNNQSLVSMLSPDASAAKR
jgi:polysaccharide chain length determinant protein (PEP-CTERM system associated)